MYDSPQLISVSHKIQIASHFEYSLSELFVQSDFHLVEKK